MAPAAVQIVCMEPVVFLRGQSAVGEDARGRRRPVNFDAPPSQLRGLLTMTLPKPSRIKEISITLHGRARTDWPEGIGPNRLDTVEESTIFKQKIVLYDAKDVPLADVRGRPRSSSVGPGTANIQDAGDWVNLAPSATRHGTTSPQTPPSRGSRPLQPRTSQDKGTSEERKSNIKKAIGKTAAKAGTAMLPPTLVRELQASRQNGMQMQVGSRPSMVRSPDTSPLLSPTAMRPAPQSMQRGASGPLQSYFEAPPTYQGGSQDSSSNRRQSDPLTRAQTGANAVEPPMGQDRASDTSPLVSIAPRNGAALHPQSISAAGPGHRSILHPERRGREEDNPRPRDPAQPSSSLVRFDPQSTSIVPHTLSGQRDAAIHSSCGMSRSPPSSVAPLAADLPSTTSSSQSSPTASRSPAPSLSPFTSSQKGKGRAVGATAPASNARKGIKGIFGTLLKEDDERQHTENRSASYVDEEGGGHDWREFKKGTYSYSFSIPLPSNLPPTLHADFGSNAYVIRAHVHRAGPLTSNLSAEQEVTLVHAPDEDGQDDMESIIVERNWEDALRYIVVVMGKSFPVGGKIPVWAKFVPTDKMRIHRIIASLEERTAYYAKGRRVNRHEVPRRWTLLKIMPKTGDDGILPIISDRNDALETSPVAQYARYAQQLYSGADEHNISEGVAALMDPGGPWELAMDLEIPKALKTRINISSNHNKSNIAVHHIIKIAIRVERISQNSHMSSNASVRSAKAPEPQRKLFDILIDAPVSLNHSQTANIWLSLPDYATVAQSGDSSPAQPNTGPTNPAVTNALAQPTRTSNAQTEEEAASAARNAQLVQLGRTWLSLSGDEPSDRHASRGVDGAALADALQPFAPSSNATVTYSESNVHGGADEGRPPTYDMIDSERGSVDIPPSQRIVAAK